MKFRPLGRTGFEVSDIAHGLWGMSGFYARVLQAGLVRPNGVISLVATRA